MKLQKYSMGIGDRFGRQGKAQLAALQHAAEQGVEVVPVWNKSHREHMIVGSSPDDVRREADEAVQALGWSASHYVDADHVGLSNVDAFIAASDFFTLDVADFIGQAAPAQDVDAFVQQHDRYLGALDIPGVSGPCHIDEPLLRSVAQRFLGAVQEAGRIYRRVRKAKGATAFVTEVSMDESAEPQTPVELCFILAAIAAEGIPAQTLAPKFAGRFNKGVDYVGRPDVFVRQFDDDLCVIRFAVDAFGLPENLKLSVHSGSDKFSLYGPIAALLRKHDCGVHLKTAGTTWLEEIIGLAAAGGDGLAVARDLYAQALERYDEMCAPYAPVIDIDPARLPDAGTVAAWSGEVFAAALRHDPSCEAFNPHFRQFMHVSYKVAAEMGDRYYRTLDACETSVAAHVTENLYARHVAPLFLAVGA